MYTTTLIRLASPLILAASLSACSVFSVRDEPYVDLVGIEPLASQDMEARFALKLRIQNPNDQPIRYNGIALQLRLNERTFASGVSDASAEVPRYGEAVISVPITISAFSVLRQAWGVANMDKPLPAGGVPYELKGKLSNGLWGATRFSSRGNLSLPAANNPY